MLSVLQIKLTCLGISVVLVSLAACNKAPIEVKHDAYQWSIPAGFPKPAVPENNPMSTAKVSLGRFLFYDKNLSMNRSQSCASCHLQSQAFAEQETVSIGSTGERHRRNAPALVNIAYNKTLTWAHDGLTELEQQILLPLFGEQPIELGAGGNEALILSRLQQDPYPKLLQDAFPEHQGPMNFVHITQALASFVRSLISLNSPFDDYAYRGQDPALSETQLAGMGLFFSEKFECHHCHGGFNFTQSTSHEKQPLDRRPFHNTGLYYTKRTGLSGSKQEVSIHYGYPETDRGLAEISADPKDDGRFRAPSLRNISLTAPYMHDGSVASLSEVIDIYAAGGRNITTGKYKGDGRQNPLKSPFIKGFDISEQEKIQLLAFLESLTDSGFITAPQFSDPWPSE